MGCPCSKQLDNNNKALTNPLQQLKAAEAPAALGGRAQQRRRRREEKRQRQLAKLQKRNARKRRHQLGTANGSLRRSHSHNHSHGSVSSAAPQLRLRGGSNGSTATECISALYARSLEQQREEQQRLIELRTRQQLERQLHTFLLNQLLLGMQFFGHFEHELAAIDEQMLAKQRACAQTLSEHSLLHANAIDAAVAKRLLFKPNQGQNHNAAPAEPLQKPLTYVVFENVDVARPNDANYDSIAALCKVLLETDYYTTTPSRMQYMQLLEQARWMGYVRLKLREPAPNMPRSPCSETSDAVEGDATPTTAADNEGIYTDASSSGYSTGVGVAGSGRTSWDEGDYDHVYIARLNTQRSLAELQLEGRVLLQRNVLPEECVCRLGSCLPAWLEQSDDEDELESSDSEPELQDSNRSGYETVQVLRQCRVEQLRRRALLQQCYLSSQRFMHYFGQLLRQQLAQQLDISMEQLATASYRGCSIYTSNEELVPAIHVPHGWPDCAFEFNLRQRGGESSSWPTLQMRKRIQSFGYHVVPVGYAPKRARNPFRELEWRIIFPQAEQFLERQLSRMQLKLLLVLKIMVRSCVNDKCQAMGHIVEQLRTHLFWQCERDGSGDNNSDWSEEFLGEQLVRFVRSFADCLAKKQLSHYFIERRNLFEHVPEDALMELRAIMAGIAEQPLVHVLQGLRQLQHAADFYPKLNYAQLLETLVATDYLQLRNKAKFTRQTLPTCVEQQGATAEQLREEEETPSAAQGLLGMRQHQERTRGKLRRKTQLLRAQQLQLAEQRRNSDESLTQDMPLFVPRMSHVSQASSDSSTSASGAGATPQLNDGVEILRRTNLLELVLDHQLSMLAKATEYRNAQHGQLYLAQTQRLCRLYQQLGCSQHAQQHYAQAICQAASQLERILLNESPRESCSVASPKFVEHVVQLHTAEVHPTSSPPSTNPTTPPPPTPPPTDKAAVESVGSEATPSGPATAVQKLETLLQRMQLEPPAALQAIGSKTEQLVQQLELRDLLKRHTQKLKSAFN
ncbi:uncharacterized protein LOC132796904 [Drosophila nasuta]|uniref:uncharacterized protein LOC132796904 n=1 Tax=Drosophila nasuta TaxID=42062 RepID=UPI00295F5A1C|nr:uncharacterized protein LOC132796904 [Drosophila nasuta]